uniref:Olfactory receptor n=1 Tax=Salvator merianae TaxID=96440 RepID=A0A8D0KKH2_SALMN
MEEGSNITTVTEFFLIGLSRNPLVRTALFVLFLLIYLVAVAGNGLIVVLIVADSQLHTPMYFFLSNLSFIDICYVTTSVPQMLAHCFTDNPTIPLGRCFAQMSIALYLAVTECLLLAVMAYDRFVAICYPLRYSLIMSWKVCILLAVSLWSSSFLLTIVPFFSMQARLCGRNVVNHFKCELQAVLKLACSDTQASGVSMMVTSVFTLVFPFSFILLTYGCIGVAMLHIHSSEGRMKALSTCGSHLAVVVSIFYGSAISTYVLPKGKSSSNHDKFVSLFYGAVIPMFNPLIYSFRNKDVKGAFLRLLGKKISG